jgi:Trypsin
LTLVGSTAEVYEQVDQGKGFTVRVNFPMESPLLRVTSIQVNNRQLCTGPGDEGVKTNIRLSLNLVLEEAARPINHQTPVPQLPSAQPSPYASYNCGKRINRITSLIVGGHNTSRGQWPWLVAFFLQRGATFKFICGATLISSRVAITAAHCIYDKELGRMLHPREAILSMGRNDITKYNEVDAVSKNAEKLIMHEDFKYDSDTINDADIGLVIVEGEVVFNSFVQPICMWSESQKLSHIVGISECKGQRDQCPL